MCVLEGAFREGKGSGVFVVYRTIPAVLLLRVSIPMLVVDLALLLPLTLTVRLFAFPRPPSKTTPHNVRFCCKQALLPLLHATVTLAVYCMTQHAIMTVSTVHNTIRALRKRPHRHWQPNYTNHKYLCRVHICVELGYKALAQTCLQHDYMALVVVCVCVLSRDTIASICVSMCHLCVFSISFR